MIGVIDNFDSFTYNIVSLIEAFGETVKVLNHHASVQECLDVGARGWILGPGPGGPLETGVCKELIGRTPVLGICLGHQLIGHVLGAAIKPTVPYHGKCSAIYHCSEGLFKNLPQGFLAARYHSLIVTDIPDCLQVTAWTAHGEVMGLQHRTELIFGLQYHPDSLATEYGREVMEQFLQLIA